MDRLKFIGPAKIKVEEEFCTFSVLLENDERVEFCFDADDMNQLTTAWLARDTPSLEIPLDSRKIAEGLLNSHKPSARRILRP